MAIGHGLFTQVDTLISMLSLNYLKRQRPFSLTYAIHLIHLSSRQAALLVRCDIALVHCNSTKKFHQRYFLGDSWFLHSGLPLDLFRSSNKSSNWFTAPRLPYSTKNTNFIFCQSGRNFGDHTEIFVVVMV